MTKKRKYLVGAGIVFAFAFGINSPGMLEAVRQGRSFERSFAAYSQAVVRHDFRGAYDMGGPEFKSATSFDEFVRQNEELIRSYGDFVAIQRGRTEVEGRGSPMTWVAVVTASVRLKNGAVELTYEFHRTGTEWKVYGFQKKQRTQ